MARLIAVLAALILFGCTTAPRVTSGDRTISSEQCPVDPQFPPLFNVLQANQEKVVVELGNFAAFFKDPGNIKYKVTFIDSEKKRTPIEKVIAEGVSGTTKTQVSIDVTKTGVYHFSIFTGSGSLVWKQKVFAIGKNEHTLSEETKTELARKYAPIVSYHDDEKYFPVSLAYLFNQADPDPNLRNEPFVLTNKRLFKSGQSFQIPFSFERMSQILPYYGHSESVLKSGLSSSSQTGLKQRFGDKHRTIYYSVFENPKNNEIFINYHFFYTYDPKNGTADKDALPAHIFDRESMTVVLNLSKKQPLNVFYGAHLPSQVMGQMDENGKPLQKWKTGRVYVPWWAAATKKGRPVPAIALGSHGIYPKTGLYAVYVNDSPTSKSTLLKEPAGGNKWLYPEFMTDFDKNATSYSYRLEDLKLDGVTSNCANPNSMLAFSGSTVDVLGPVNATFPPYTDREEDYFNYADISENAPMFEMDKDQKASD